MKPTKKATKKPPVKKCPKKGTPRSKSDISPAPNPGGPPTGP